MSAIICGALLQLFSLHQDTAMNDHTPGAGVECQGGAFVAAAGAYRNSENQTSAYAAAGGLADLGAGFRAGAVAGVVTGYSYADGGAMPMAAGVVTWDAGPFEVQAFIVPHVEGVTHAAVQFGVFIPFVEL